MPEKIVYQKKKVQPAPVVVVQKPVEEDDFTAEQKAAHQTFLDEKISEFEQEDSVLESGEVTKRSSSDYAEAMANKELDKIKAKDEYKNYLENLKNKKK